MIKQWARKLAKQLFIYADGYYQEPKYQKNTPLEASIPPQNFTKKTTPILTKDERIMFTRLYYAFNGKAYILPQQPLITLVNPVDKNDPYRYELAKLRVDFVIVSKEYNTICVIECDGDSHKNNVWQTKKDIARNNLLKKWGIPVIRLSPCEGILSPKEETDIIKEKVLRDLRWQDANLCKLLE